ncbi:MAG: outer membrane lipid asymmetry maintenance protein MlaD, partial [Rhodospirillales bacterium]|nr:outer membrane lipid asymmetry maintenance protein MlaD [Rhodospirillales bacterium]
MGKNLIESVMGAVVLLVAAFFLIFAYSNSNLRAVKGYPINARFSSIGGLARGSDVRINGVKVGTVAEQHLDPGTFAAVVVMNLAPEIKLPTDTVASISAEGLLGGKYVRLDPGHAQETIPVGGSIHNTRDFKSVEELVADIIFLA